MSKHTPGPWSLFDDGSEVHDRIVGPVVGVKGMTATVARAAFGIRPNQEVAANARLIAAAPDLLAACESVIDGLASMGCDWGDEQHAIVSAAIRKAKGMDDDTQLKESK